MMPIFDHPATNGVASWTQPAVTPAGDPRAAVLLSNDNQAAPAAMAGSFLKWTLAMVALWFALTALYEYGGAAGQLTPYLAGLIVAGVLFTQGPKALQNLKGII